MILIVLLLQIIGLTFAVFVDPYIRKSDKRIMGIIILLVFGLIVQNVMGYMVDQKGTMPYVRTWIGIIGYIIRPVIIVLFCYIVNRGRSNRIAWMMIGVNALIYLTASFSPVAFRISENNEFQRGPLGYSCHIVSGILLAYLIFLTIRKYNRLKGAEMLIPLFNALLIVVSVFLDTFVDYRELSVTFLSVAVCNSCVFYYIWLHLQFVREHERDLMAAQRIEIMMTQIQPHFLFNALNTIRALYAKNPPLADTTLENFSTYLRQNLESLSQSDLIPVSKELEHTRLYAEIEMLRFPGIRIEYHIQDDHFDIPALTIQPLVENAIRHGVCGKKDGLVTVSSVREANLHRITVSDNGKGFDPEKTLDGTHIGLRNVKERVEQMCGGKLILQSEIGKGTCITLLIPEGRKEQKP
jgi:signal transduction histidine kinase